MCRIPTVWHCVFTPILTPFRYIIDCQPDHVWLETLVQMRKDQPGLMSGYFLRQIACYFDEDTNQWVTNKIGPAYEMNFIKEPRFPNLIFGARIPHPVAKEQVLTLFLLTPAGLSSSVVSRRWNIDHPERLMP